MEQEKSTVQAEWMGQTSEENQQETIVVRENSCAFD